MFEMLRIRVERTYRSLLIDCSFRNLPEEFKNMLCSRVFFLEIRRLKLSALLSDRPKLRRHRGLVEILLEVLFGEVPRFSVANRWRLVFRAWSLPFLTGSRKPNKTNY